MLASSAPGYGNYHLIVQVLVSGLDMLITTDDKCDVFFRNLMAQVSVFSQDHVGNHIGSCKVCYFLLHSYIFLSFKSNHTIGVRPSFTYLFSCIQYLISGIFCCTAILNSFTQQLSAYRGGLDDKVLLTIMFFISESLLKICCHTEK